MSELVILICLEELMLTKPVVSASALFVITSTFLRSNIDFSQCDGCHHLMQKDKKTKMQKRKEILTANTSILKNFENKNKILQWSGNRFS